MRRLILIAALCVVSVGAVTWGNDPPRVILQPLLTKVDKPVQVTHDGTERLFVVEQSGRVLLYESGAWSREPYLDLSKKVFVEYECGLLSIAFHPEFASNGYLYANYTANFPTLKTIVAEFRVDPKASRVEISTERILLHIHQPYVNHNGGQLKFGPDGYLYIGMGDGGSAHDPHDFAQNPQSYLGKMLRIDVNKRDPYGIPADNPFIEDTSFLPEIHAYGLRNPWRFSFDRETGLLYAADVGQDQWEEVDIIEKGGNYGWRIREGRHDLHPVPKPPKMIDPIFEYTHAGTAASITGGYVYRGKAMPTLRGWYVFGEYVNGRIYAIKYDNGRVTRRVLLVDPENPEKTGGQRATQPSGFGEDIHGELYLCDVNGAVYRIVEKTGE